MATISIFNKSRMCIYGSGFRTWETSQRCAFMEAAFVPGRTKDVHLWKRLLYLGDESKMCIYGSGFRTWENQRCAFMEAAFVPGRTKDVHLWKRLSYLGEFAAWTRGRKSCLPPAAHGGFPASLRSTCKSMNSELTRADNGRDIGIRESFMIHCIPMLIDHRH
jgi:hypothetical protein